MTKFFRGLDYSYRATFYVVGSGNDKMKNHKLL